MAQLGETNMSQQQTLRDMLTVSDNEHKHKCKDLNEQRLNVKKAAKAAKKAAKAVKKEKKPVVVPVVTCASCGANDPTKQCSRCEKVTYCNRECQVAHWGQHKADCQK